MSEHHSRYINGESFAWDSPGKEKPVIEIVTGVSFYVEDGKFILDVEGNKKSFDPDDPIGRSFWACRNYATALHTHAAERAVWESDREEYRSEIAALKAALPKAPAVNEEP